MKIPVKPISWNSDTAIAALWGIVMLFLFYIPQRTDHIALLGAVLLASILQWVIWTYWKDKDIPISKGWILAALGVVVLWAPAHLSEDVYRFYWDGQLLVHGIHPYAYTPTEILELKLSSEFKVTLHQIYPFLNSPDYYSVYPPVSQYLFGSLVWMAGKSFWVFTILFRATLLICLGIVLYFTKLLLQSFQIPTGQVIVLALHPLIWIEGIGNFHFELTQLALISAALWVLHTKRIFLSGILWGLAVWIKLLPLMLLLFIWRYLPSKEFIYFLTGLTLISIGCVWPLWDTEVWLNIGKSLDLYFRTFEFNASIYYLARWLGFMYKGYNLIHIIGPLLALGVACTGFLIAWRQRSGERIDFYAACSWIFFIYFMFATTIHPWYLMTPLLFAMFVRHYFIWVWSIIVLISYTAYMPTKIEEQNAVLLVEYMILIVALIVYYRRRLNHF